jgi:hypothetical protein
MRVFASIVTVAGLVAVASADLNNACPSSALLNARGGGFFDKLDAKISSMTKSSNDVRSQGGMPSNQVVRNARHQSKRLEGAAEEDLFCLPTDAFTPPFPPLQVMDKATKSIDKASSKAQNGIDQADAKLKKVQADTEVRSKVKQKGDVEVSAAGQGQGVRRGRRGGERWPKGQCMEWKRCQAHVLEKVPGVRACSVGVARESHQICHPSIFGRLPGQDSFFLSLLRALIPFLFISQTKNQNTGQGQEVAGGSKGSSQEKVE